MAAWRAKMSALKMSPKIESPIWKLLAGSDRLGGPFAFNWSEFLKQGE
jgi:hypothetical protein